MYSTVIGVHSVDHMPLRNLHRNDGNGFVLVKIKSTERWLLMKPPVRAIDGDWIGEIGDHFNDFKMARMERDRLNSLSYCKK